VRCRRRRPGRDLDGEADVNVEPDGVRCVLSFALKADVSLEDVPASAVRPA
jgi:hypothetical protein